MKLGKYPSPGLAQLSTGEQRGLCYWEVWPTYYFNSFDYEPPEYDFIDNEPEDYANPEHEGEDGAYAILNGDGQAVTPGQNGENAGATTGDASAAASKSKVMLQQREKKVPDDQRSTTPYMTKYERARVLGTRALQIRYCRLIVLFA